MGAVNQRLEFDCVGDGMVVSKKSCLMIHWKKNAQKPFSFVSDRFVTQVSVISVHIQNQGRSLPIQVCMYRSGNPVSFTFSPSALNLKAVFSQLKIEMNGWFSCFLFCCADFCCADNPVNAVCTLS